MGKSEIIIFIVLTNLVVLILIGGIISFVFRYRKRKILYDTEKQETTEQHRIELLAAQLQMRQQTMEYIGSEIHDSITQKLTLASIYTQRMDFESGVPAEAGKLSGITKIINDSLGELRQLSRSLTDEKLQAASLPDLIRMECVQVNATGICFAKFEMDGVPVLNIAAASSLIRIVQEFIQNSVKHAACKKINIRLHTTEATLLVIMEDDGIGFDPQNILSPGSGLNNIRRRIQMMGGEYSFTGADQKGTCLQLTIPLNKHNT